MPPTRGTSAVQLCSKSFFSRSNVALVNGQHVWIQSPDYVWIQSPDLAVCKYLYLAQPVENLPHRLYAW